MKNPWKSGIKILRPYAFVSALLLPVMIASNFAGERKARFDVLDVGRINIVEKDGTLKLAISNRDLSPGVIERGKALSPGNGRTGLIFYNDEGTECGGLIFSGQKVDGKLTAVGSLTFDQYETDQTLALQYVDDEGRRRSGLSIVDYPSGISTGQWLERNAEIGRMPDGPAKDEARRKLRENSGKPRLYVGRSRDDGASLISLSDAAGRERLRLRVDSAGVARIDFLDERGQVVRSLGEAGVQQVSKAGDQLSK